MSDARGRKICALILLPVTYNADAEGERKPVEDAKFMTTADEIAREFGGGTIFRFQGGRAEGFWWEKGVLFQDDLAVVEVDVPDSAASREWLRRYVKNVLLERFQQEAIYIKFVGPIERMIVIKEEVRR